LFCKERVNVELQTSQAPANPNFKWYCKGIRAGTGTGGYVIASNTVSGLGADWANSLTPSTELQNNHLAF
jgi:hypothetical protein